MKPEQIAELEALCEAATPGPWFYDRNGGNEGDSHHGVVWCRDDDGQRRAIFGSPWWSFSDSELAAASRTALPEALEEIKRLRAVQDLLVRVMEQAKSPMRHNYDPDETTCALCRAITEASKALAGGGDADA